MPGPSDYRYEPFSDISSGVTLTEWHLIPATSPYVVRLNEVPQKNSPSTMAVKEITNVNGATVTYGNTFDEVAANPSANQFWPDYNTGADGNDNWNTGLLEFNSADAGKLIEVSYTGTGTLASVKANRYPAWWLDRGDGSDGAFNPTGNTTISGEKNYTSVFIKSGVTVSVTKHVKIKCQGFFINNGTIEADAQGANGGGGGTGNGGNGANAVFFGGANDDTEEKKMNLLNSLAGYAFGAGGGGGGAAGHNGNAGGAGGNGGAGGIGEYDRSGEGVSGGKGGGGIAIVCREFANNGTISANGGKGTNANRYTGAGGGGGGGVVVIIAESINTQGTITVNGGAGGSMNGGHGAPTSGAAGFNKIIELGVT